MFEIIVIFLFIVIVFLLYDIKGSLNSGKKLSLKNRFVMDTSALIDGRVVDIAKSGFINGEFIIPKKVLNELQLLADGRDSHKRERSRFGLESAEELKSIEGSVVKIDEYLQNSEEATDEVLLKIAKKRGADLCTTDFNLNKVATVEGINVLNVNELAQYLRPKALPGESVDVKIIQKGESSSQGVGYLDDGTMVVVEGAGKLKLKTVSAKVDRTIQTKAGKMIFADYKNNK